MSVGAIAAGASLVLLAAVLGSYLDHWDWTGIGPYRAAKAEGEETERGKTLWDLLQLLVIPAVLTLGALWLGNQQQTAADRQRAQEQEADTVLNSYLDHMTELLVRDGLAGPHPPLSIQVVARARTVAALRTLDSHRNELITEFLADSHLYRWVQLSNADLSGANLKSADLDGANLNGATLDDAHLENASLQCFAPKQGGVRCAQLKRATLQQAHLDHADLPGAQLQDAFLAHASLVDATLTGAHLEGATLDFADLSNAKLGGAYLRGASLDSVVWHHTECPDGSHSDSNHSSPESCGHNLGP